MAEQPVVDEPVVVDQPVVDKPVVDWDADDNPYKKRYGDSQGQIQPLVRTLNQFAEYDHTTKAWKPKTQAPAQPQGQEEDVEKLLEGYDPDFKKAMGTYFTKQIGPLKTELDRLRSERQASEQMAQYSSGTKAAQGKAIEEFGDQYEFSKNGKFNTASPLYKLANEILTAKYAQFNPDGSFHRFSTADAEYMATVEAYAIMAKREKQPQPDKGKLAAIQGKGTKAAGVKSKLSYEEYSKLSNDDKDAYDLSQTS